MWLFAKKDTCVFFLMGQIAYALLTCTVDDDGENGDPDYGPHVIHSSNRKQNNLAFSLANY